jgi:hypothetical protein
MWKWVLLLGLAAAAFLAYKRFTAVDEEEDWDDDTMYGSAELHEAADAPAGATV